MTANNNAELAIWSSAVEAAFAQEKTDREKWLAEEANLYHVFGFGAVELTDEDFDELLGR